MKYEGAVLDLDGTIYRGEAAIPGAVAAVERLWQAHVETVFFSNNPTKSREAYASRLRGFGLEATPERILSSGTVSRRFLTAEHDDDSIFLIGDVSLATDLRSAGLHLVEDPTEADVLLASWTADFDFEDMLSGYRALAAGATFYGTDPDRLVPATEGMVPGSGSIINAVGGTVDRMPERILGKPSAEAQRAALETLGVAPEQCFVVGDRLNTDVELGKRAGMTTVLVRTGITGASDLDASDVEPDHVLDSMADVPDALGIGE